MVKVLKILKIQEQKHSMGNTWLSLGNNANSLVARR